MAVHDRSLMGFEAWPKLDDIEQGDEAMAACSVGGTESGRRDQAGRTAPANQRLKLTGAAILVFRASTLSTRPRQLSRTVWQQDVLLEKHRECCSHPSVS